MTDPYVVPAPPRVEPPLQDPEGPRSLADLAAALESGCKPFGSWAIGVEHEVFAYDRASGVRLPFEGANGVETLLQRLGEATGGQPLREGDRVVGLQLLSGAVTTEPGGQIEFSTTPCPDLHHAERDVRAFADALVEVADELGVALLASGFDPVRSAGPVPEVPKARYDIMRRSMPGTGRGGLDMMHRTCSVQACLDVESEAHMVRAVRVATALQPVVAALFGNSPIADGAPTGRPSQRAWTWATTDSSRTGPLDLAFDDGFGFERYAEFALDVPMYFVRRSRGYVDVQGASFRDFLAGKLDALPGERPSWDDWSDHLGVVFTEVRLRPYVELRGADAWPASDLVALPALWTGLLYDSAALYGAYDIVRGWTAVDRRALQSAVLARGLDGDALGRSLRGLAQDAVTLAADGLRRRDRRDAQGEDERRHLEPLRRILDGAGSRAAQTLRAYDANPGTWPQRVFDHLAYHAP